MCFPVSQLQCKCVKVYCSDLSVDYVVEITNNYDHHNQDDIGKRETDTSYFRIVPVNKLVAHNECLRNI